MEKLSWIIRVGQKCNHMYPCKRESEGDFIIQKRRGSVTVKTDPVVMRPRGKEDRATRSWKRQEQNLS